MRLNNLNGASSPPGPIGSGRIRFSFQQDPSNEKVSDCFGRFLAGFTGCWLAGVMAAVMQKEFLGKVSNLNDMPSLATYSLGAGFVGAIITRSPKETACLAALAGIILRLSK